MAAARPAVFISYSHKDEHWKDRLVAHLRVLEREGALDLWDDRRIAAGEEWRPDIEQAIRHATVAVLIVSKDFLTSKFIREEELTQILARRSQRQLRVIPLIAEPCAWQAVGALQGIQARPIDGRALSGGTLSPSIRCSLSTKHWVDRRSRPFSPTASCPIPITQARRQ